MYIVITRTSNAALPYGVKFTGRSYNNIKGWYATEAQAKKAAYRYNKAS